MSKPKVLIAQKTNPVVLDLLGETCETVAIKEGDKDDLVRKIGDCQAILLGTWIKFTDEIMAAAPALKVISRTGAGVDNVDIDAATKRGIMVLNTPGVNASTVAEHAITLICALAKHLVYLDSQVRRDNFKARRLYLPVDLDGKTLGVAGFGAIGRLVAEKCVAAFAMRVVAYDPFVKEFPEGVRSVTSVADLCREADFLSMHMPLTPETKHLINAEMLSLMKPGSFIINTSRGGVVDEDALCDALAEKRIAGAGLDVLEAEPPSPDSRLFTFDNVIVTPHSSALTNECTLRVARCAAQGILDFCGGGRPRYVFNKEVLK